MIKFNSFKNNVKYLDKIIRIKRIDIYYLD